MYFYIYQTSITLADPRVTCGLYFAHASSSGEQPKLRSHVPVHAHISGEGAENMGMANTARGKAC